MRTALLLTALAAAGCVTGSQRDAWPVFDPDRDRVRVALSPVAEASLEKHTRGENIGPGGSFSGYSFGMTGQAYWGTRFTLRTPDGAARDVSPDDGRRILTGVRADLLAAVEKTGANMTWAPAPAVGAGPNPEGRFEIRYLRKLSDGSGDVSGEVVGKLIPVKGQSEPESHVRIDFKEWVGK